MSVKLKGLNKSKEFKKDIGKDKSLSRIFSLKYFKPLVISSLALLFTITGALAIKNAVAPHLLDEKHSNQSMEENVSTPKSEIEILDVANEKNITPAAITRETPIEMESALPSPTSNILTNLEANHPQSLSPAKLKAYSIIPIATMSIGSMEPHLQVIAYNAYQEFLGTANLNQLDESTQVQVLMSIYSRMLKDSIAEAQQNTTQLNEETQPTATPEVLYINLEIEAKLDELRQTLSTIQNQTVAINIIEGRQQRAYQDWMGSNSEIYSLLLSSRYVSDLNSILSTYGL